MAKKNSLKCELKQPKFHWVLISGELLHRKLDMILERLFVFLFEQRINGLLLNT